MNGEGEACYMASSDGKSGAYSRRENVVSVVSVDLSGAFRSRAEIPALKRAFLSAVTSCSVQHRHVDLVFCQQPAQSSGCPVVPPGFLYVGHQQAFILYDQKRFAADLLETIADSHGLVRNLDGVKFSLCRLRDKEGGTVTLAGSCYAEPHGTSVSLPLFRRLVDFIYTLMLSVRQPVLVASSNFTATVDQLQEWLECADQRGCLRCLSYHTTSSPRRRLRSTSFLLSASPPILVRKLRPLRCGRLHFDVNGTSVWRDAEDVFFWDALAADVGFRRDDFDVELTRLAAMVDFSPRTNCVQSFSGLAQELATPLHNCRLLTDGDLALATCTPISSTPKEVDRNYRPSSLNSDTQDSNWSVTERDGTGLKVTTVSSSSRGVISRPALNAFRRYKSVEGTVPIRPFIRRQSSSSAQSRPVTLSTSSQSFTRHCCEVRTSSLNQASQVYNKLTGRELEIRNFQRIEQQRYPIYSRRSVLTGGIQRSPPDGLECGFNGRQRRVDSVPFAVLHPLRVGGDIIRPSPSVTVPPSSVVDPAALSGDVEVTQDCGTAAVTHTVCQVPADYRMECWRQQQLSVIDETDEDTTNRS